MAKLICGQMLDNKMALQLEGPFLFLGNEKLFIQAGIFESVLQILMTAF